MKISRKNNAIKGTIWGILYKLIHIIFPFIIRTIFIHSLGAEYLGLNSLFTAILQVLNLAELGVSSALVFSMYRPIVDNDSEKICQLMNLYQKYYRIIGLVIMIIGLCLIPFLHKLIKGNIPSDVNINILYGMHLTTTVLSYWMFAYRNSLFRAHHRVYVVIIIQIVVDVCMYMCQVLILTVFRNYYLYLSVTIVGQLLINIITAIASKKEYPQYKPKGELPAEERKSLNQKVRDLFTAKLGGVINNAADSVVISAFIGLKLLAVYQNYYYIISAIMSVFTIFFTACTAGIGNSLIVKSKQENKELLYNINHIVFFGINFSCSCFVSLCQPFIKMWVGEMYKLDFSFVLLFAVYLFAEEAPRTLIVFKDAGGIWKHDRFRPLISACFNLVFNLILTPVIGLHGIILSTVAALLCVSLPWVIVNINKHLFCIDIPHYIKRNLLYTVVIALSVGTAYLINEQIHIENAWINLFCRFLIAAFSSTVIFGISFVKTKETEYMMDLVKGFLH